MAQFQKGEDFTSSNPGNIVTDTRLDNLVDAAIALPGLISEQTLVTSTAAADLAMISQGGALKSVSLANFNGVGAVSAAQLVEANRQGVHQYAAGALSAGVYAVTLSPAATAYTAGMKIQFKADAANLGAVDVNVNALGAKNLFYNVSEELPADFIRASQVVEAVYDGTSFQVVSVPWKAWLAAAALASGFTLPASAQTTGATLQSLAASEAAMSTTTATIPFDDTVPGSGEGAALSSLDVAITPNNASNILEIEARIQYGASVATTVQMLTLFQDAGASAIAMATASTGTNGDGPFLYLYHRMTAGTTSATTFKVRIGTTGGTITINGSVGARVFGGIAKSWLRVREIKG